MCHLISTLALQGIPTNITELDELALREIDLAEYERLVELYGAHDRTWNKQDAVTALRATQIDAIQVLRRNTVMAHGQLGVHLNDRRTGQLDDYGRLSLTPKVSLTELRRVADVMGFVLIPFALLDKRCYTSEPPGLQTQIARFAGLDGCDAYVLCPIGLFNVQQQLEASNARWNIYTPAQLEATMMAIQMMMPALREMYFTLLRQGELITEVEARQQRQAEGLETLRRQVQTISARLDEQQRQAAVQRAEAEAVKQRLLALEQLAFQRQDPTMFAVPKGVDPTRENTWAAIGPCWGPDFEEVVLTSLGLTIREGQQQLFVETNAKLWGAR